MITRQPTDAYHLRLAAPADLPALHALIPQSVRALSRDWYTPQQIESAIRFVFGPDTQLIADGTYFVVETAPVTSTQPPILAACGGWSRRRTLYGGDQHKAAGGSPNSIATIDDLLDPATEPARIRAFFVGPDHARRGLATRLLNACREAARTAGFTRLELAATLPGVPFYARHGFQVGVPLQTTLPDRTLIAFVRMFATMESLPPP